MLSVALTRQLSPDPAVPALSVSMLGVNNDMTVHTDITPADWTAFVRFVTQSISKSSGGRFGRWLIAAGVGAVAGVAFAVTGIGLHFPSLLVGAVGGTLWIVIIARIQMRRMIPAPDGSILGPRQVTLSDDGLREASERHETLFHWRGVRSIQITGQHVFVMVDNNAAMIIPRRAFASDGECEQFIGEIQRRVSVRA